MMKNYFNKKSYSELYTEQYPSFSNPSFLERKTVVEYSIGCMQLLPKTFEVKDLINDDKPYFHLMFHVTLQFFVDTDFNSISFFKFRFSISGDESEKNINDFKSYPIQNLFSDFIKNNYKEEIKNLNSIKINQKTFKISKEDKITLEKSGNDYLDLIFKKEHELFIINQIDADFYKNNDSVPQGIEIYEKNSYARLAYIFEEKFLNPNQNSHQKKIKKI